MGYQELGSIIARHIKKATTFETEFVNEKSSSIIAITKESKNKVGISSVIMSKVSFLNLRCGIDRM